MNAKTGALKYSTGSQSGATPESSPSIANGVVYVNCQAPGSTAPDASPGIVNGMVYTACGYNNVCTFGLPPNSARAK